MTQEGLIFGLILLVNTLAAIIYLVWNIVKRKKSREYWIKAGVMLLCPVAGILLFALSQVAYKLLFFQEVDLEDVMFSKERVKIFMHADEERERNMVPLEEALAISDKESLRGLMLNVIRGDIHKSLAAISLALNSEDSETSHYAASVLQDELNGFREKVQRAYREIQKNGRYQAEYAAMLIGDMNQVLEQQVFSEVEQKSMVDILDKTCEILYRKNQSKMSSTAYEAICLRLLEVREFESCEKWCSRQVEQYPESLASYTCQLKLYYASGKREKFFQVLERLKESECIIDNDTLELIRIFN